MKSKRIFKIASIICLICFYLSILLGIFVLMEGGTHLWIPNSGLAESFDPFKPIFSEVDIDFFQAPPIYDDTWFLALNLVLGVVTVITALLFFWLMYKLLKNIHADSLFMYANVSILIKLGLTVGILGAAFTYLERYILKQVLEEMHIDNAQISLSSLSYIDSILSGIVLIIIAFALKTAVHAVEENKKTI